MSRLMALADEYVETVRAYGMTVAAQKPFGEPRLDRALSSVYMAKVVAAERLLGVALEEAKVDPLRHHALKSVRDASNSFHHYKEHGRLLLA